MVDLDSSDLDPVAIVDAAGLDVPGVKGNAGRRQILVGDADADALGERLGQFSVIATVPFGPNITIGDLRDAQGVPTQPLRHMSGRPTM
jgi:hypothetical protein